MAITDNITFVAVYKYRDYYVTAEGLEEKVKVTYNSDFTIKPQTKEGCSFIGYFSEKDGNGTQITNEKGESLMPYNIADDLTVYPYFRSKYMNKIKIQGATAAMPGDEIAGKVIFATDRKAMYLTATIKYSQALNFKSIKGVDFAEAAIETEKIKDGFKYMDIICVYDYNGGAVPTNKAIIPFELLFDVPINTVPGKLEVSIENVILTGDADYEITDIKNNCIEIKPKLAESIEIIGSGKIDKAFQYTAEVYPDYTTDKSVEWSVDDENVATISADGILTPVKNGTVTITAATKDGSGIKGSKTVEVIAYAKIDALKSDKGVWSESFTPTQYEYTIYVNKDADSIELTPEFKVGTLRPNGTGLWISGKSKQFHLSGTETVITLNRNNVENMTDSEYKITVVKYEGVEATVSEDGKVFSVKPVNIADNSVVILALYNEGKFVDMQSKPFGTDLNFTTDKTYTDAKIMVWESLGSMKAVCDAAVPVKTVK